jgi:hypothetical protein
MPPRRKALPVPPHGVPFLGEHDRAALTSNVYVRGFMRRMRNYHLGIDGATKRYGTQPYQAIGESYMKGTGTTPIQSLAMYDFSGTRHIVGVCGGDLYAYNGTTLVKSAITGALTIASGADSHLRWAPYDNSTNALLIGSDGTNPLFKWTGTGNATVLGGTPPTKARGIAAFQGRLFVINTDAGATATEYSNDATVDTWGAGQIFHCSRSSEGMALVNHGENYLIAFHRKSWHKISFFYVDTGLSDSYFRQDPGGETGLISPDAAIHYQGVTYFASSDGIYAITDPEKKEKKISGAIDAFWEQLVDKRIDNITVCERGRGFNEIVFFVSTVDTDENDAAIIYNPEVAKYYRGKDETAGWTIFESASGYLKYNCGLTWTDSSDREILLLGGYDGMIHEGWGNDQYATGYLDGGTTGVAVTTELWTGYVAPAGPAWVTGLRALQADLIVNGARDFSFVIYGNDQTPAYVDSQASAGGSGDELDVGFIFDQSYFTDEGVAGIELDEINGSARYFQAQVSENSQLVPHSVSGLRYMHVPERKAIA